MNGRFAVEPDQTWRVQLAVFTKTRDEHIMFYVYDLPRQSNDQAIAIAADANNHFEIASKPDRSEDFGDGDIDFVDDALLNTAPHNVIEKQLLRGDVVGLALMSGAIIWSAMGAFG